MLHNLNKNWQVILQNEFSKNYFSNLHNSIHMAFNESTVFPAQSLIFNAFNLCPFDQVKVVILGQDPYHGTGQAHGLAFSVPDGVHSPPSLKNIYKEIRTDIGQEIPTSGNLEHWAKQGVLLLNSTLTVEKSLAASHQKLGWEKFTDVVIQKISEEKEHVVFLLWGNLAKSKSAIIDDSKHLVLKAAHPSPFSAYNGFFGCKHFSQTNTYLAQHHQSPIKW